MPDIKMPETNVVIIAGKIRRDPELRYTANKGAAVCKFAVQNLEHYRDAEGQRQEKTTLVDCEAWNRLAEWIGNPDEFRDGTPVQVQGKLKTDRWTDKQTGSPRYKLMLSVFRIDQLTWNGARIGKEEADQTETRPAESAKETPQPASGGRVPPAKAEPEPDDDLPF